MIKLPYSESYFSTVRTCLSRTYNESSDPRLSHNEPPLIKPFRCGEVSVHLLVRILIQQHGKDDDRTKNNTLKIRIYIEQI